MAEDKTPKPKMTLIESSPPPEEQTVVDFNKEKLARRGGKAMACDINAETVLEMALMDCREAGDRGPAKAYITLVYENDTASTTVNYRCQLSHLEEVAYRQLGLSEAIENWKGSTGAEEW